IERRSNKTRRNAAALPPRAASTNKVARLARCSAPALIVSTQRRSRSPRSEVESRSLMARIPVSGVRTSCANAASAASTMPAVLVALLVTLLRDLRGVTPEARFFGGRILGDRILSDPVRRRERDFPAMIPPDPGRSHLATARL